MKFNLICIGKTDDREITNLISNYLPRIPKHWNFEIIEIPKMNFMHLIERYPYYGIFLSRLLATRLAIQSKQVSKLKEKKSDIIATNFSLES